MHQRPRLAKAVKTSRLRSFTTSFPSGRWCIGVCELRDTSKLIEHYFVTHKRRADAHFREEAGNYISERTNKYECYLSIHSRVGGHVADI